MVLEKNNKSISSRPTVQCSFPQSVNKNCLTPATAAAKENKTPNCPTEAPLNTHRVSWLLCTLWAWVTLILSVILLLLREAGAHSHEKVFTRNELRSDFSLERLGEQQQMMAALRAVLTEPEPCSR